MHADAIPLLAIFEKKMQLEVPLFQRQYVWSEERQWADLWKDIARKFSEHLEGNKDGPVHFLGAMVLDQKQTPMKHVERRQVIDGQQRLTTFQIFLAAFRDFCAANECPELDAECESFTLNKGMMADPVIDQFKVWPTKADRPQFQDVMTARSRVALEKKHPILKLKFKKKPEPRPRMVEAYLFFYEELEQYFAGSESDPPLHGETLLASRLEECFQALKSVLQVVVIDLEKEDDAQVIFETLNARGEPLLPADLLRNHIFLRAGRAGENQDELYAKYWIEFDDEFWRHETRQGRLSRPRSDLFMQHFLASRKLQDIPVRHLFAEYRHWVTKSDPLPFASIRDELATLARQREHFREIISPPKGSVLFELASFLEAFDARTAYPLLLALMERQIQPTAWKELTALIESYLLRRAICGLTTKNYNRNFLLLTKAFQKLEPTGDAMRGLLNELTGDSGSWPTDDQFETAWLSRSAYQNLNNQRIVHVLRRLNDTYASGMTEHVTIESPLSVEHLMPQSWRELWPLQDGSPGMEQDEMDKAPPTDPRRHSSELRDTVIHTFGNLTILSQPLNSALSNAKWSDKKAALIEASLLPINLQLHSLHEWHEDAIAKRGAALFERARAVWPR